MFEIAEASGVRPGTKIIIRLKEECKEFANEDRVKGEQGAEMKWYSLDSYSPFPLRSAVPISQRPGEVVTWWQSLD